jgi:hypothetical protein
MDNSSHFSKAFEVIKHWDCLPNDAVVSAKVGALLLGCAERTIRYSMQDLPRVQISEGRYGFRVGDLRRIARTSTGRAVIVAGGAR